MASRFYKRDHEYEEIAPAEESESCMSSFNGYTRKRQIKIDPHEKGTTSFGTI